MQQVTFQSVAKSPTHETFRCVETGICYQIELELDRVGQQYAIRNSGVRIGSRTARKDALSFMQQQARLDFLAAQADCGQYRT